MHKHIRNIGTTILVSIAVIGATGFGRSASAAPIDDKRAQAQAIQDQIEANGERIGALGEAYNAAQLRVVEAERAAADAQARIDATRREVERIRFLVDERAASVYRRALAGRSLDDFDVGDSRHLVSRRKYAAAQADRDDSLLDQLDQARADLTEEKAAAERAHAEADAERSQIAEATRELEAANAQQEQLLQQVQGELQQLVEEEQRRRQAEEAARARARYARGAPDGGNPEAFPNLPPPGPAAAAAIEFARAEIGKPYVYGASGPDAYDCSGLTMAAWGAAGVSLPHYSGAQYSRLPKVPLDAMQPGDLVFWGSGGSRHVGLYVGNGLMIHAPHTGDVVRIAAVYGRPVGAARPGV